MLRFTDNKRRVNPLSITLVVMLAGLIGCIVTSGLLFEKRKNLVQSITESGSENFTWAFNQLRVEFYRLQAMSEGVNVRRDSLGGKDWEAPLRKRYEIFVSRVNTVDVGAYRDNMIDTGVYKETMPQLRSLVTRMDAALGSRQSYNIEAVQLYLQLSRSLAPSIDEMTAKAVEVDSERLGEMRSLLVLQESYEQINLAFQLAILIAFASLAFYGLFRLDRQKQRLMLVAEELQRTRTAAQRESDAKRKALERALSEEQRHNVLQRRFVSMASHEFRTPLAVIDSTAQRLLRKLDRLSAEEIADRINRIRRTVARMGELMETMLEAGRSEEGKTQFNPAVVDLDEIVQRVVHQHRQISADHRLVDSIEHLPPDFHGDPRLLEHALANLLSNAVKYSPKGSEVGLRAACRGDAVVIEVSDQGVGIPAAEIAHIGEVFFRASTSAGIPGTGVGFNLVKKFIELHGGTIDIGSRVGVGTTFTIHLPLNRGATADIDDRRGVAAR
ncbi:sensor histidine kinase [Dongia sp.]|uniref:sensor histidine kinase n=1 Tax=Dongia sp. TaxID=1977262 RepID=UPI0035AEA253